MSAPIESRPACFDDPVKLHQAARIVRASLARQGLTLADLVPAEQAVDDAPARTRRSRTSTDGADRRAA